MTSKRVIVHRRDLALGTIVVEELSHGSVYGSGGITMVSTTINALVRKLLQVWTQKSRQTPLSLPANCRLCRLQTDGGQHASGGWHTAQPVTFFASGYSQNLGLPEKQLDLPLPECSSIEQVLVSSLAMGFWI